MLTVADRRTLIHRLHKAPHLSGEARSLVDHGYQAMERQYQQFSLLFKDQADPLSAPPTPEEARVVLLKPVGDSCNLRCRYCFNHPDQKLERMSDELLESLVRQVLEFSPGHATFILHGGEPLLAGKDFFRRFLALQEQHRRPAQRVRNFVTTNGTLLDREWCELFRHHKIKISLSIDGPPEIHDANRVDAAGNGSMKRVLRGLEAAQNAGLRISAISVVTHPAPISARALFDYLRSIGIVQWRANPCRAPETVEGYGTFVEELFDLWCQPGSDLRVAILSEILDGLLGYSGTTCWMKGSCHKFFGVDPDGTVSPCCEMSVDPSYHYGNLLEANLPELLEGEAAQRFWNAKKEGDGHCSDCEWNFLCKGGGCTYHRLQFGGDPTQQDYLCDAYRDVFQRVTTRVDGILTTANQEARQESPLCKSINFRKDDWVSGLKNPNLNHTCI